MDLSGVTTEMQDYIKELEEQKSHSKWLSSDVCQKILEYASEAKSDVLYGLGYYYYAEGYWYQGDNDKAMHCLTECTKYFQAAEMYEFLAKTYNMMGAVADHKNNSMIALNYYFTAQRYAEKYHYYYVQGMAENNIAFVLVRMKMYMEAIKRYYRAINCYKKATESADSINKRLACMTYCGFCHVVLEEKEEVLALEGEVCQLAERYADVIQIQENISLFKASCEFVRDNNEECAQLLDLILEAITDDEVLETFIDDTVIMAALLDITQDSDRMERLMDILTQDKLNKHLTVYLDVYPFKSRYFLRKNRIEEYVAYTKEYFRYYEQYQQENNYAAVNMLKMKDKLKKIEAEQIQMLAYNEQLEKKAMYDSMTGLANRTCLNEYLAKEFEQAFIQQELLGVEMLDIDFFKQYNDSYGHLQGDRCIEAIADILRGLQSDKIFCARYGGDEFMVVYSGMTTGEIKRVAETIQEKVRSLQIPHKGSGCSDFLSVSQGIFVRIPSEVNREWDYNSAADKALYEAKEQGRNCYCIKTRF